MEKRPHLNFYEVLAFQDKTTFEFPFPFNINKIINKFDIRKEKIPYCESPINQMGKYFRTQKLLLFTPPTGPHPEIKCSQIYNRQLSKRTRQH